MINENVTILQIFHVFKCQTQHICHTIKLRVTVEVAVKSRIQTNGIRQSKTLKTLYTIYGSLFYEIMQQTANRPEI